MDPRITNLTSIEQCETFERNAEKLNEPALAIQARTRKLELKANEFNASSSVERECLLAVFAYEETLLKKNGKHTKASRTWQMIKRRGILAAAEQAVTRPVETAGFRALHELGLDKYTFEAVILRHQDYFTESAIAISKQRLAEISYR